MRILFGFAAVWGLAAVLSGCGAPEAEFSYSDETKDLLPAARKTVETYVEERFGTPAKMVAWQRLPIAFGGVQGIIEDVVRAEEDSPTITGLKVNFRVPAMIAKYDVNLDGQLSFSEFPIPLQESVTRETFDGADGDKDGFATSAELDQLDAEDTVLVVACHDADLDGQLSRSEFSDDLEDAIPQEDFARVDANQDGLLTATELLELDDLDFVRFATKTIPQVTEANVLELTGKDLLFVDGPFSNQRTQIKSIDPATGEVEITPALSDAAEEGSSISLVKNHVIVDFGRTMESGRHLYMRHCMHCHGVTGDGNGPTAKYLSPIPRDYRQGIFKFISTRADSVRRPARDDLGRVVRNGIPGTYMPSFAMLKDEEVHNIIEYVRWLSMRGQYEGQLNVLLMQYTNKAVAKEVQTKVEVYKQDLEAGLVSQDKPPVTSESVRTAIEKELAEYLELDFPTESDDNATQMANTWRDAELLASVVYPKIPKPPSSHESIARGRQLFLSKCAVCHGVTAEGNGENTRGYQKDPQGNEYPEPGFFDAWGDPIQPRNLNTGIYRGGRRPLDIYRRIHQGIPGTPMQAFGTAFTDEQIWDLVDYVMSIPIHGPVPDQDVQIAQKKPAGTKVAQSQNAPRNNDE